MFYINELGFYWALYINYTLLLVGNEALLLYCCDWFLKSLYCSSNSLNFIAINAFFSTSSSWIKEELLFYEELQLDVSCALTSSSGESYLEGIIFRSLRVLLKDFGRLLDDKIDTSLYYWVWFWKITPGVGIVLDVFDWIG